MKTKWSDMEIKGAIFDMDGTIVDSMGMWYSLYAEYLKEASIPLTDELEKFLESASIPMAAARFAESVIPRSADVICNELFSRVSDYYLNHATTKANAEKLIRTFYENGVKMCVATATESDMAKNALERLDLLKYFDGIFSCKDIKIEKNKPDIYLFALSNLGTKMSETVVFEDAHYAVKTAKNAGFYVVAIEDETVVKKEQVKALADKYIKDYDELIK